MGTYRRIVVKIGTSTLAPDSGKIDKEFLKVFVDDLARLHKQNLDILLVSSGAVRTGMEALKFSGRNLSIPQKQAAASVGQGLLIEQYAWLFSKHGIIVGQALLTRDVMIDRKKYLNARNTIQQLLQMRVTPIINENDTVSVDELRFGDNDTLSAQTAILANADLLIILSDVDGLYDRNPNLHEGARRIEEVTGIDKSIREMATGPVSVSGSGGMQTKIDAADICSGAGIAMVIARGREPGVVPAIVNGEKRGTWFHPKTAAMPERKKWIAYGLSCDGYVQVNRGAAKMIVESGKSLLPSGVIQVRGAFEQGACVEIQGEDDYTFAKGLVNYGANDIRRIMGLHSSMIQDVLGFKMTDEVVHRDNLAVLNGNSNS